MKIVSYTIQHKEEWNRFVHESKNGTFLLNRDFMDYHSDRFTDCSLLVYNDEELIAVFPANWAKKETKVYSHQGLTYGGLIVDQEITAARVLEIMREILNWYTDWLSAKFLVYKAIPYIYSIYPSEEDLYALFRLGAVLKTRSISSVVKLSNPIRMRTLRIRGAKKAIQNDLYFEAIRDDDEKDLFQFWKLLDGVLMKYHKIHPVHSAGELQLLMRRFPKEIRLFVVRSEKEIVGGCVVFVTKKVAHVQYIAACDNGREQGALDLLFRHLITERYKLMDYLDFGISTENQGRTLNEGLIFQKEGFGGRAVCYDTYEVELNKKIINQK